jgi:hypothetical protein
VGEGGRRTHLDEQEHSRDGEVHVLRDVDQAAALVLRAGGRDVLAGLDDVCVGGMVDHPELRCVSGATPTLVTARLARYVATPKLRRKWK